MKKLLLLLLLTVGSVAFAQQDAWVYFADKPGAANYFSNPLLMLSQRSLDRRTTQQIPLDIKDVPVSMSYIAQIKAATGITVLAKSKWLNAVHVRGVTEDIQALLALSIVSSVDFADDSVDASTSGRPAVATTVKKTSDTQQFFNYGTSDVQVQMLNGHLLHQQDYTGTGKVIAILDAGFPGVNTAAPFQSLQSNNKILGGYNFVQRNTNFYSGDSHGTFVLSAIGARVDEMLVGTAPDASYYLFVTENNTSENPVEESLWVEAAEVADSLGVDVINSSLGYFIYDNPAYSYNYSDMNGSKSFITRGADIAFTRGMIVVNSAGNSGASSNPYIGAPADGFNVLTVGAVNAAGDYASFSSIGPTADGRVKPDIVARGHQTVLANPAGTVVSSNGTSFSAPVITGLVACLWQALPDKTNAQIVQLIKQSASYYDNPNPQYGYGIPDFYDAQQTALGITDNDDATFIVYPNPVADKLNVLLPHGFKTVEVSLYNSTGQIVLHKQITVGDELSVGSLSSGLYFYSISGKHKTSTGKLIIK